jgi:hypothetical protein
MMQIETVFYFRKGPGVSVVLSTVVHSLVCVPMMWQVFQLI